MTLVSDVDHTRINFFKNACDFVSTGQYIRTGSTTEEINAMTHINLLN
jgi:hypothetical protein